MTINGTSDPYVLLRCGDNQAETQFQKNTVNPIWEEAFTFDILTGKEILDVIVMDQDTQSESDNEGILQIPIDLLRDQEKKESWFNLEGPDQTL